MSTHAKTNTPATIRIEGDLNIYRARDLKNELMLALNSCQELEINLEGVSELDSAGVQLLALLKKEALRCGKSVRLTAHSPATLEVIDTLQLALFFGDPPVMPANTENPP
jgi:anti-sigma B factor antagonist